MVASGPVGEFTVRSHAQAALQALGKRLLYGTSHRHFDHLLKSRLVQLSDAPTIRLGYPPPWGEKGRDGT